MGLVLVIYISQNIFSRFYKFVKGKNILSWRVLLDLVKMWTKHNHPCHQPMLRSMLGILRPHALRQGTHVFIGLDNDITPMTSSSMATHGSQITFTNHRLPDFTFAWLSSTQQEISNSPHIHYHHMGCTHWCVKHNMSRHHVCITHYQLSNDHMHPCKICIHNIMLSCKEEGWLYYSIMQ